MVLRHLRSFCVVAEEGHVTRAARRLNVAQPGLTQQIKALEELLGVTLIRRTGRGIEITPTGRYLQKEAEGIFEHVRTVCDKAKEVAGLNHKCLDVGITGTVSMEGTVTERLEKFRKKYPEVTVHDVVLEPLEALKLLKQNRIDVVFSCSALSKDHSFRRRVLGPIPTSLALSRVHHLAGESSVTLRGMVADTLIIVAPCASATTMESRTRQVCDRQGFAPQKIRVTSDLFSALSQVASNSGIALVPRSIQTLRTDAVRYLPVTDLPEGLVALAMYIRRTEQSRHVLDLMNMS